MVRQKSRGKSTGCPWEGTMQEGKDNGSGTRKHAKESKGDHLIPANEIRKPEQLFRGQFP